MSKYPLSDPLSCGLFPKAVKEVLAEACACSSLFVTACEGMCFSFNYIVGAVELCLTEALIAVSH